ncbi:copper homeostasis protein [Ectocarpus siliculosus]|uniref:Copper homeostasis protein cutC homolog n=1 Tax=Ectocarpus siliculosus TaxID=2880 RepID=D8LQ58_ECTSI|nr:copper homeostasis protein [Ectocarpus siliculosus]|eukprot:CBN77438.1 copper homeostasis protein [Ectocarpus siliculosus]
MSASQARSGGAHRIELCANLAQGGVTPSAGDIEGALLAVRGSRTRVHVLIRPRPGDFVYSVLEKQVMEKDVSAAVKAGAHGVVIGVGVTYRLLGNTVAANAGCVAVCPPLCATPRPWKQICVRDARGGFLCTNISPPTSQEAGSSIARFGVELVHES